MSDERSLPQPAALQFANAISVEDAAKAVTELNRTKQIFAILGSEEYRRGLSRLAEYTRPTERDLVRLKAIAILAKLRATLKKKKGGDVEHVLKSAVASPLPSLQLLEDGEERSYAASALEFAPRDWLRVFIPRELFLEERSDNTWKCLAKELLAASDTVEVFLELLHQSNPSVTGASEKPGDVAGKRFKRILAALRLALHQLASEPGSRVGDRLAQLTKVVFRNAGIVSDLKVARELSEEMALLIDDLVRAQISLVVNPEMFAPLQICKRWFPLSTWPQYVARSPAMIKLARTICEGIQIAANQGLINQGLFDALELARGSRERALQMSARMADANPGLPDDVQSWLRKGYAAQQFAHGRAADESAQLQADDYVALALLESIELEEALNLMKQGSTHLEPGNSLAPRTVTNRCLALVAAVQSLARARAMRLVGRRGETAEYSPLQHVATEELAGAYLVRIDRQGVERIDGSGNAQLLKKLLVTPIR